MSHLNFLYQSELPHRAISVYAYLSDRANKNDECWPAIPTIAGGLKLSESTVRRALRDLRKAGLIAPNSDIDQMEARAVCATDYSTTNHLNRNRMPH